MKKRGRDWAAAAACLLLVGGAGDRLPSLWAAFPSLCLRSAPSSPGEWRGTLEAQVFWQLRFPRMCMGLLAGWALGLAGGVYQTVFRNPLASPRPDRGGLGGLPGGGLRHRAGGRDPAGDHGGAPSSWGWPHPGPGAPAGGSGPAGAHRQLSPGGGHRLLPGGGGAHDPEGDGRPGAGSWPPSRCGPWAASRHDGGQAAPPGGGGGPVHHCAASAAPPPF